VSVLPFGMHRFFLVSRFDAFLVLVCTCLSCASVVHAQVVQEKTLQELQEDGAYKKQVAEAEAKERDLQKQIKTINEKLRRECEAYAQDRKKETLTPLRSARASRRPEHCTTRGSVMPTKLQTNYAFIMNRKRDGRMIIDTEEGIVSKEKVKELFGSKCARRCKDGVSAFLRPPGTPSALERAFACAENVEKKGHEMYAVCREDQDKLRSSMGGDSAIPLDKNFSDADVHAIMKAEQSLLKEHMQRKEYLKQEEGLELGKQYNEFAKNYAERFGKDYDRYLDAIAEAHAEAYSRRQELSNSKDNELNDETWYSTPLGNPKAVREEEYLLTNRMYIYRGMLCSSGRMTDAVMCNGGRGDAPLRGTIFNL
jgi:hypothetical protein